MRFGGAWVAAAAFVVTLLVGGLTWILSGGESPSPVADEPMLLDSFMSGDVVYEFRAYPNSQGPDAPCVGVEYDLETSRRATMACPTMESEETTYAGRLEGAPPWTFVVGFGLEPGESITDDDAIRVITTDSTGQRRFFLIQYAQPVDDSYRVPVTRPDGTTRFITLPPPEPPMSTTTTKAPVSSESTVQLLDGSDLGFVGPSELELTGYRFTVSVPEFGQSTVDVAEGIDPADPAAVDEAAVLHSDLGDGIRLWRTEREGQPFYMSIELDGWGAVLHVGNQSTPDTDLVLSLADQFSGTANSNGVVLDEPPELFTTYLRDPATEDQIHLEAGQCIREQIPGGEIIEDPTRGQVIRGNGYASWCDQNADIEVRVYGDEQFVEQAVNTITLQRDHPDDP